MSDCRTCKYYTVENIHENELYIIRIHCEKDCKEIALMMSSQDCADYTKDWRKYNGRK